MDERPGNRAAFFVLLIIHKIRPGPSFLKKAL